ncbi:MAG: hypothetical protein AAGB31_01115, partial [Bdellovibrio sp.]
VSNVARSVQNRYLNVQGNVYISGSTDHDRVLLAPILRFTGTGNQTLTGAHSTTGTYRVDTLFEVNKPSGTLTVDGVLGLMQQFIVTSGAMNYNPGATFYNLNEGTSAIRLNLGLTSQTLPNLLVKGQFSHSTPLYVENLTISGSGALQALNTGDRIYVKRDLAYSGSKRTPASTFVFDGSGYAQNISITHGSNSTTDTLRFEGGNTVNLTATGGFASLNLSNMTTLSTNSSTSMSVSGGITVGCGSTFNQNSASISGAINVLPCTP